MILVVVCVAQFLIALDYSIVYLALPSIASDLRLAASAVQWVVSGYAVMFAGFLVVGGRLTDRFGAARMFVIAAALFGLSSGAGAAAGSGVVLIAARATQGLGAALLQPAILGLIGTNFPAGAIRSRALASWAAVGAAGLAAGALLGGLLTTASWRLTLLVNVPPALACAVAARGFGAGEPVTGRVPLLGAALSTGAILTLTLSLTFGTRHWRVAVGCLLAAVILAAWFARHEAAAGNPLIEPALRQATSVRTGVAAAALYMASAGSEFYLLTLLLQTVRHYTPLRAGFAFLPLAVMVTVGSAAVRRASPAKALTAGFLAVSGGLIWVAVSGSYDQLLPGLILGGLGHGAVYTATFVIGGRDVPDAQQGTAAALLTTAQYLSGTLAIAVLTLILNGAQGFTTAFGFLAAVAAVGAILPVLRTPGRHGPPISGRRTSIR